MREFIHACNKQGSRIFERFKFESMRSGNCTVQLTHPSATTATSFRSKSKDSRRASMVSSIACNLAHGYSTPGKRPTFQVHAAQVYSVTALEMPLLNHVVLRIPSQKGRCSRIQAHQLDSLKALSSLPSILVKCPLMYL